MLNFHLYLSGNPPQFLTTRMSPPSLQLIQLHTAQLTSSQPVLHTCLRYAITLRPALQRLLPPHLPHSGSPLQQTHSPPPPPPSSTSNLLLSLPLSLPPLLGPRGAFFAVNTSLAPGTPVPRTGDVSVVSPLQPYIRVQTLGHFTILFLLPPTLTCLQFLPY